ncbi:hypothetical protein [Polyangium jinanense]|uniref:hypothetical protein n=1 Tax=Polyangium jinanense TaxID=2829994 RepID=UPI0023411D9C|nr:hypothetical protein [Polyangium jinanense]MDC3958867.1 hypothetical protein [Polyangium jinanense]
MFVPRTNPDEGASGTTGLVSAAEEEVVTLKAQSAAPIDKSFAPETNRWCIARRG